MPKITEKAQPITRCIRLAICENILQNRSVCRSTIDAIYRALSESEISENDWSFESTKKYYYRWLQSQHPRPTLQKKCLDLRAINDYVTDFICLNKTYFRVYGGEINKTLTKRLRVWVMIESGVSIQQVSQIVEMPERTLYHDLYMFRAWLKSRPNHQKPKQF